MKIVKGGGRNGCFDVRLRVLRLEAVEVSYLPVGTMDLQLQASGVSREVKGSGSISRKHNIDIAGIQQKARTENTR